MKYLTKYKNWRIYLSDTQTDKQLPLYIAVKCQITKLGDLKQKVLEGVDLPDLQADIDECELSKN